MTQPTSVLNDTSNIPGTTRQETTVIPLSAALYRPPAYAALKTLDFQENSELMDESREWVEELLRAVPYADEGRPFFSGRDLFRLARLVKTLTEKSGAPSEARL